MRFVGFSKDAPYLAKGKDNTNKKLVAEALGTLILAPLVGGVLAGIVNKSGLAAAD